MMLKQDTLNQLLFSIQIETPISCKKKSSDLFSLLSYIAVSTKLWIKSIVWENLWLSITWDQNLITITRDSLKKHQVELSVRMKSFYKFQFTRWDSEESVVLGTEDMEGMKDSNKCRIEKGFWTNRTTPKL